jgi:hypothetical protein
VGIGAYGFIKRFSKKDVEQNTPIANEGSRSSLVKADMETNSNTDERTKLDDNKERIFNNMDQRNAAANQILAESFTDIKDMKHVINQEKKEINSLLEDIKK